MERPMSEADKIEYDRLTEQAEQLQFNMDQLMNNPVTFGYARVSSKGQAREGNSLEAQTQLLIESGALPDAIYTDVYTGTVTDRPELDKLLAEIKSGDTLIVTKLDRLARSVQQGVALLNELSDRGVTVKVLNMGTLDNSPSGKMMRTMLLAFAEFERDMILERTREGKEIARKNPGYHEGRNPTYTEAQLRHAVELLQGHSYTQVAELTGISKSTLIRAKKKFQNKLF